MNENLVVKKVIAQKKVTGKQTDVFGQSRVMGRKRKISTDGNRVRYGDHRSRINRELDKQKIGAVTVRPQTVSKTKKEMPTLKMILGVPEDPMANMSIMAWIKKCEVRLTDLRCSSNEVENIFRTLVGYGEDTEKVYRELDKYGLPMPPSGKSCDDVIKQAYHFIFTR